MTIIPTPPECRRSRGWLLGVGTRCARIETSRTLVFDAPPRRACGFFEALCQDNLDLGPSGRGAVDLGRQIRSNTDSLLSTKVVTRGVGRHRQRLLQALAHQGGLKKVTWHRDRLQFAHRPRLQRRLHNLPELQAALPIVVCLPFNVPASCFDQVP